MLGLAVCYSRVSSKEQEREGYSIPAQINLLEKYAQDNDFEIIEIFKEAETAKASGRKQFNAMLKYLEANPDVKYLLCEKTDRLSRNFWDIAKLDKLINEQGLSIILVKDNIVLSRDSKSNDKFMFGIQALMAKNYIDNLSEEVKKGQLEKAKNGKLPGGKVPFGYLIDKNKGEIYVDDLRAPLVVQMFEMYAENKASLKMMAQWARENSVMRHNSTRPLTKSQIERILKNPFYTGKFKWNGILYDGIHAPIISKDLFSATQKAFKAHNKPQYQKKQFAFSNMMLCSVCGCKVTSQIKKGKYVYYHCTGMRGSDHRQYLPESHIESELKRYLGPISLSKDEVSKIQDKMRESHARDQKNKSREQARLSTRLQSLDKWIEQSYIDKIEGKISEKQWQASTTKWEQEAEQIRSQIDALSKNGPANLEKAEKILELSQKLPMLWDSKNNHEKRKLTDMLYSNCLLDGRSLSVTYRKPFNVIAEGSQNQNWLGDRDSNPNTTDQNRMSCRWTIPQYR